MSAIANLGKQDPIKLALGAVIVIAVVYYLTRKTVTDAANGVAGLVSGDNAVTRNQHDASGQPVTAYVGAGATGTLGAAANSASGGVLASAGSAIGGWVYDLLHSDSTGGTQP